MLRYTNELRWLELGERLRTADPRQHEYLLDWMEGYVRAAERVMEEKARLQAEYECARFTRFPRQRTKSSRP